MSEDLDDYFLLREDGCTLAHNCLGRVKGVKVDKTEHLISVGRSRELGDALAKEGDGCVLRSGFIVVDLEKVAREKSQA